MEAEEKKVKTVTVLDVEDGTATGRVVLLVDVDNVVIDVAVTGLYNTRLIEILDELDLVGQFVKDAETAIGMIRRVSFTRTRFLYS